MKNHENIEQNPSSENKVVYYAIQLVILSIILIKCFHIIEPFINILLWGAIFAITLQPLHKKLSVKLKGRKAFASTLLTISLLLLIIVPSLWLMSASIEEVKVIKNAIHTDQLTLPAPNESVKKWPIVGEKIYTTWEEASTEKGSFVIKHGEQIKPVAIKLILLLSSVGKGILLFIGAIIVGGILLVYSESISQFSTTFLKKIAGNHGNDMNSTITSTIKNVAKGIIGVAFIQSTLVGIGLLIAGVPFAGLWAILCLILAIVQIGIFPVAIGVIIYIWGSADTTTAVLLTIWIVFLSLIDNVLKPILMGKGAPAPMLVVFIGTIGGFIANGFIGLFTGAIILSIVYNLLIEWLNLSKKTTLTPIEIEDETIEEIEV